MVQTRAMYAASVKIEALRIPGVSSLIAEHFTDAKDLIGLYLLMNDMRFHHELERFIEKHRVEYERKQLWKIIITKVNALINKSYSSKTYIERTMSILDTYDYLYDNVHNFNHLVVSKKNSEDVRTLLHVMHLKARDLIRQMAYEVNHYFDIEFSVYFKNKMDIFVKRIKECELYEADRSVL